MSALIELFLLLRIKILLLKNMSTINYSIMKENIELRLLFASEN